MNEDTEAYLAARLHAVMEPYRGQPTALVLVHELTRLLNAEVRSLWKKLGLPGHIGMPAAVLLFEGDTLHVTLNAPSTLAVRAVDLNLVV